MLIIFEGIDGTGKSTQVILLDKRLNGKGNHLAPNGTLTIAEPTNSKYGKEIRQRMMNSETRLSFEEELDLFIKDRKFNIDNNINPALEEGKVVILDRYYFSTAAYQGSRGYMDYQDIIDMNEKFAPVPSILFIFFIPVEKALERIDADAGRSSRSYMEKAENLKKVQDIFQRIHESGKYNSVSIDSLQDIDQIHEKIWSACKEYASKINIR
ncbi:MAG: dTMP kinase [Candidatus Hodarchaeota archaeon]